MLYNPKWEADGATLVLLAAADYIELHGWCRGSIGDLEGDGPVCPLGAIIMVIKKNASGGKSYAEAIPRLKAFLNRKYISIWFDRVCDSEARAVATLRAAAFYK
jgi:hypothetical protein